MKLLFVFNCAALILVSTSWKNVDAKKCHWGQVWTECGQAEHCDTTCETVGDIIACPLMCVARCQCPREKPILHQGKCIAAEDCHKCHGGQVWNDCGSACPRTCEEPNPPCNRMCVPRCQCPVDKPLLKHNKCVAAEDC